MDRRKSWKWFTMHRDGGICTRGIIFVYLRHDDTPVGGACDALQHPGQDCNSFAGVSATDQTLLRNSIFPKRNFPLRQVRQAERKLSTMLIQEQSAAVAV